VPAEQSGATAVVNGGDPSGVPVGAGYPSTDHRQECPWSATVPKGDGLLGAQSRPVRSRRSGPVIAVTSAASPAGSAVVVALLRRLGSPGGPRQVLACDVVPPPSSGSTGPTGSSGASARIGDISEPVDAKQMLAGADIVVHLAASTDLAADLLLSHGERRVRVVRSVQEVATAAASAGAERLVVVTSAMVFGARSDNRVPLPDDAPLQAPPDDGIVGDLLEVERILARLPRVHPGLRTTVVRPAALVGTGVDTVVTRHFEAPRLLSLRGAEMRWQFCHVDDLGEAVAVVVEHGLDGAVAAGTAEWLTTAEVEQLSGLRRVELSPGLAYGTAERLHRARVLPMPAADLALVVHPWVVGSERLLAAGWRPGHDTAACLAELLEQVRGRRTVAGRRVERRDAALGAAGAAVAIMGTAALMRQARARRSGRRRPTL
jgi:nucleoside-diphosphate-sugar epimerase